METREAMFYEHADNITVPSVIDFFPSLFLLFYAGWKQLNTFGRALIIEFVGSHFPG